MTESYEDKSKLEKDKFGLTRSLDASKAAYDLLKTSGQTALLLNGAAATAVIALLTKEKVPEYISTSIPPAIIAYAIGAFLATSMLFFAMLCADYWNGHWMNIAYEKADVDAEDQMKDGQRNERLYTAIGRFVFWFSKLEGMLKADLAGLLDLDGKYLDSVVSAFDFASLCNTMKAMRLSRAPKNRRKNVEKFFSRCMSINESRVRVAHGDWTLNGARIVSRNSKAAAIYFAKPEELDELSKECETLTLRYFLFVGDRDSQIVEPAS